jgi:hypothetical protein
MNDDIVGIVEEAVRLARDLGFVSEYTRWADRWLEGLDRTRDSAHLAVARVRQWVDFAGDSWASRCVWNAAAAAEELARGHENSAASSAEAAIRHAGYVRNPPPERDRPPGEPELVFDDWNRDSNGVRRGRSYDPREV